MSLSSGLDLERTAQVRVAARLPGAVLSAASLPDAWSPRRALGFILLCSLLLWALLLGAAILLSP
ncbi:MAG: hypothetical protein KIT81_04315 [Alphaproteobacteria bacterium]|nr:hypothetical protein [Alphaproteobacteria bacterium]